MVERRVVACCRPDSSSVRTRPTTTGSTAHRTPRPFPKDGINDHVIAAGEHREPGTRGHQGCVLVSARHGPRGDSSHSSAPDGLRARCVADPRWGRRVARTAFDTVIADRRREADEFYESVGARDAAIPSSGWCNGRAFAGLLWSKKHYRFDVRGGSTATPQHLRPRNLEGKAAMPTGLTSSTPTSSRCRTSGSTRGTRHGTSRSTRFRWLSSIPSSRRSSCCFCAASGSCTRTGSSPRTSGRSTT